MSHSCLDLPHNFLRFECSKDFRSLLVFKENAYGGNRGAQLEAAQDGNHEGPLIWEENANPVTRPDASLCTISCKAGCSTIKFAVGEGSALPNQCGLVRITASCLLQEANKIICHGN